MPRTVNVELSKETIWSDSESAPVSVESPPVPGSNQVQVEEMEMPPPVVDSPVTPPPVIEPPEPFAVSPPVSNEMETSPGEDAHTVMPPVEEKVGAAPPANDNELVPRCRKLVPSMTPAAARWPPNRRPQWWIQMNHHMKRILGV